MNSALKTIKNALEVLPDNVLLEVIEDEWWYDGYDIYWKRAGEIYSGRITEGFTEMYDLFMCNVDVGTGTCVSYVFLQDKRLTTNPEEEV